MSPWQPNRQDMVTGTNVAWILWGKAFTLQSNLRPAPQERVHSWYCKYSQKHMHSRSHRPNRDPTNVVLINGHVVKLPSKYCTYIHRLLLLSALPWGVFFFRVRVLRISDWALEGMFVSTACKALRTKQKRDSHIVRSRGWVRVLGNVVTGRTHGHGTTNSLKPW